MQQVGYSLIDKDNKEVMFWGDYNSHASMPEFIILPNKDIVYCPEIYGNFGPYKLVKRFVENNPPSSLYSCIERKITFNNGDTLETYVYPDKPNLVPESVTPLQLRKALNKLKLRETVDDYIKALDQDSQDSWEYATIIMRNNSLINDASVFLKKSQEDVDELFRLASTL